MEFWYLLLELAITTQESFVEVVPVLGDNNIIL